MTPDDLEALERALGLAELGRGSVSPNPLVGAIIVGRGAGGDPVTLGEGHHAELGAAHAERAALADCRARGGDPRGATMYVSLEPCSHHGRQPPCVEAILEAGIERVVIAAEDPSDKASGAGPRELRAAGIEVDWADAGDCWPPNEDQRAVAVARRARLQNQPFRKHSLTGRPLVVLKAAASMDGRVATRTGESKWITSPQSRARGHQWRAELDAIAVGSGTAIGDDPELTARPEVGEPAVGTPLRFVFDSGATLPLDSRLIATIDRAPLVLAVGPDAHRSRIEALRGCGVEVAELPTGPGGVAVEPALDLLGERAITSLLLEGGPRLAGSFADAGQVDEVRLFTAPLLLGAGRAAVEGTGIEHLAEAPRGTIESVESVGDEALVVMRLNRW